jgi:AcrR family transcriptional regulator
VGAERLTAAAGMSRGALYHQFADKADLFAAVLEEVEAEIAQRITEAVAGLDPADTTAILLAGAAAWLDASSEPDLQRIVLLDGPSVLGWDRWREICLRHSVGLIALLLQDAIDRGSLPPQPVLALTHVLVGAVDEAALFIAQAEDRAAARADIDVVLGGLVTALTRPPSAKSPRGRRSGSSGR